MELNWICVTHQPYLSPLMCCHKAPASLSSRATQRVGRYHHHQQWGQTHECVAAGASLWPRNELSWQPVTRLFSPVCLSVHQIWSPSWTRPLAVPCPELRACRLPSPLTVAGGAFCASLSTAWDDSSVMAMSTGNDFTLHEMLTRLSQPLIDWPYFTARRGLLIGLQLPADTVTIMEENYCCLVMHYPPSSTPLSSTFPNPLSPSPLSALPGFTAAG